MVRSFAGTISININNAVLLVADLPMSLPLFNIANHGKDTDTKVSSQQGCCVSRSTPDPVPQTAAQTTSSAPTQEIASRQGATAEAQSPASTRRNHGSSRLRAVRPLEDSPLGQHINRPLRRHSWVAPEPQTWTRKRLDRERAEFFDTRVTGRPEIWQNLQAALHVLWEAQLNNTGDAGLATAQSIIDAAEISVPTGRLADGAYDSLGGYYQLPQWVVTDPQNIHSSEKGSGVQVKTESGTAHSDAEDSLDEDARLGKHPLEENQALEGGAGKDIVTVTEHIVIRARLSENGKDVQISIEKRENVKIIAQRILDKSKVCLAVIHFGSCAYHTI